MIVKKILILIMFCLVTFGYQVANAQSDTNTQPTHRFSGVLFSDYYFVLNNHNEDLEGENGFWARRINFTYDNRLSQSVTTRFRLESNSPGDFSTNAKMEPFVKDLYLNWAMNENHVLIAGLSPTPTWGLVETIWGYRSVEKSPLDLYKLGSSRDFGIALRGKFGESGKLNYHAMFGNGSGTGAETNKWKKYMLSISWWFTDHLAFEVYGDYDRRTETNKRTTYQLLAGYVSDKVNIGAIYASQTRTEAISGASDDVLTLDVASVFTNFKPSERWTIILRVDHVFDPNPKGPTIDYIPFSSEAGSTLMIFGFGYQPIPRIHIIPNIETVSYGEAEDGTTPDNDVIFRTTLHVTF